MKYLFLVLAAAAGWAPAYSQTKNDGSFTITGKVTNLQSGVVYLRYTARDGKYKTDSALLQNGAFQFSGAVAEPVMAGFSGKTLSRGMDDPNYTGFFLEPGKLHIEVADQAFKDARISGSVTQQEYAGLQAKQRKLEQRWRVVMDTLHEVNKRSNFEYQELKDWVLVPFNAEMREIQGDFIKSHPASYVTAYLVRYSRNFSDDSLKKLYAAFPAKVKQSSYGKAIVEELENRKKGVPGAMAAAFSTTDINGQPLSLSDFKGKYVLVDFWASWCVPCRKGNPHLKELYAQYKDKGFEVIGVSDDDSKPDAWKNAVAKDALPWKHVLRGMKMTRDGDKLNIDRSRDISAGYNVSSLPTQVLIGPDGIIIGRYGEGGDEHAALDEKLQTIFKTNSGFVLNGSCTGASPDMLYLSYANDNDELVKDSCVVKEGRFSFKGAIKEPTLAVLQVKPAGPLSAVQLFIEPAVMTISVEGDNIRNGKLTGSASQAELEQLTKGKEPIRKEMEPLLAQYSAANKAYMDAKKNNADEKELDTLKYRAAAIHDAFEPYNRRMALEDYRFFEQHPHSAVTAFYLRYYVSSLTLDSLKLFYDRLGNETQQTGFGKYIAGEIQKMQAGSPGSMAKNFSTVDIDGKALRLADFKGRYVLVDFWASWCVPCRKGNPHLKELYALYKSKGFEVIGVSDDDRDHAAWKKAVEKDGLPWQHVLRGLKYDPAKGYDKSSDISELFGVHSLPTQILIDPSGKIIGRYGEGGAAHEDLDKTLAAAFN